MLSNRTRKHLKSNWKGVSKNAKNRTLQRLRISVPSTFDDIVLISQKLSEKERRNIFNPETLTPVVQALLGYFAVEKNSRRKDVFFNSSGKDLMYYELAKLFYEVSSRRLEELVTDTIEPSAYGITFENISLVREMLLNWQIKNLKTE